MRTLAILGNGFDMAHKLKTSYDSFVDSKSDVALDRFKEFWNQYFGLPCTRCNNCIYFKDQTTWNNFELGICSITENMSHLSFNDDFDYHKLMKDIAALNQSYDRIRTLLANYLWEEMMRHSSDLDKHSKIAEYIDNDTQVISFNYTHTAEIYSPNVYYIHGSLAENHIVLGYDDIRYKFDVEDFSFTEWDKAYRRDELGLIRCIRQKGIKLRTDEFKDLLREFRAFSEALSCRGIDDGLRQELKYFNLIEGWSRETTAFGYGFNFDLSKVERIVIIGHSLFSDKGILESLFSKCESLESIVLFCYGKEEDKDKKMACREKFLRKYCDNIIPVEY